MKRVLFIVNGLGLGNATRSDAIRGELEKKNVRVDLAVSGNALRYFRSRHPRGKIFALKQIDYCSEGRELRGWKTFVSVPGQLPNFLHNVKALRKVLSEEHYDAVVSDSDYSLPCLGYSGPTISINHADRIARWKWIREIPADCSGHFLMELLDRVYHRYVPTINLSPTLFPSEKADRNSISIPPLVRFGSKGATPEKRNRIVVLCSGSRLGLRKLHRPKASLRHLDFHYLGVSGKSRKNWTFHGFVDVSRQLREAHVVILNGGFSSIAEVMAFRKPCLVIPIPHHAEQFIHAKLVEKSGIGLLANTENWQERLEFILKNYRRFERAFSNARTDGAFLAARIIRKMAEHRTI